MGRRRALIAAALLLFVGTACGSKTALPRYVYYPPPTPTSEVTESSTPTDVAVDGQDDPAPVDYVDARPAADRPSRAAPPPAPAPLNLPRGAIGRVEIPKLGVSQPVFEGATLDVLANGPGHWQGSAMPGDNGNTVFAGHRVTHTHPFLDIDQLVAGDQIVFTTAAGRFVYAVTQSFVSNGSPTAVVSFDLTGSAGQRGFWGPFNAQPVNVGSGNTFQVVGGSGAAAGIQISLT